MEKLHMAGFQEAAVVPQSLPLGLLGDNRSAGAPRPYPSGETCRSPPLLPELNSQAGTEDIGGVALAVMAGPETELVKGPASPQPEVRRRKFKRARVVKEIETVKMGTAGEWEQANPLEKERAKMGASVQRFLARMQDVQGDRKFSEWKGSVVDSVVGTFLTQNVSDHLSSSAYMNIAARWPIASQQPSALNGPNGSTQGAREVRLEAGTALCEVEGLSILQPGTGAESASLAAGRAEHSASPASSLASRCRMESGGAPKVSARTGDGAARFSANLHDENEKRGFPQSCSTRDDGSRQGLAGSGPGWEPRVWNIEEAGGVMVSGLPVTAPPRVGTSWPGDAPRGRNREAVHEDGVDWEGVRAASVEEIADAIKERGMHMMLAARIKSFLDKVKAEHGRLDLEWLRERPAAAAREYLNGLHGLGIKSAECILLLCLHQPAFPVDTNVGRICVRLGWVPLEPLDEELQLHLLDQYPIQQRLQEYLWRRLSHLGQRELYELHYQLITFGKVFCTKRQPNCLACPMRDECKHYASAKAHKEQKPALPEPSPLVDPRTPPPVAPSPSAASPPPPRRLKAPTPRARPHESNRPQSSSLQPQQLVSQVGYEPPHACEDSGGEGLSRNWAVLRATGGSHRAWYTEVRPSGARCRPPGQTAAGTSVASARDAREEDLRAGRRQRPHDSTSAQALALLRELRRVEPSVLASCRLQSGVPPNHTIALFASNFSHPEQPAGVSGGEARVETGTVPSFSPFSRARSARHLLPALNTLYTASAQLSPTGDRLAVLPRELTTATVRESAPHTVVAAGLHARQLESPGTGRQVGRPSVTDRPVVPSPWSRLDSPAVAQVLNRPLAWSGFSTRNSAASGGVSTDRLTGPRQLTELSLGAQRALLELATVLSRRQAVGSSRRLSPPPLPAVTAAALPQSQIDGTSRGLLHAQALEGLKRVWSVHLTRLEKVPLRNGFTVTGFKPDPPKPSPFREPAASAPLSNPVDRTTAVQSSGQGLVSPSYSRAIVPYQGLPSNAPPLLHTPPYGHGYRTDQPSATGLPDLNIPLSFPDEEIARGLRETVKGAALDARKRGIGRKLRVPTMFWTLPLKRPEKLRTLRHAVRLPEDHPLLRQFQRREADDPCPYFAVLWPACLVLAFPTLLPDLNEAPVEDSAEATPGDRQIAAGMKQVAESLHLEGGHSAACGVVDASMSQASLEVGARSADVSEECARPQLCAASRVHSEPAAPPLSCQGNAAEAGEQSLGAVDVVSTRPSTEQSFVEPTAMVLEPSKSITPPAEAPSEMTCHHLIDTVPDAKFEGTAQVAGEPLELTVRSGRLRRPRSMRMRSGHGVSWHNRRLQLSGPPALRTESLHRPPETKREAGETQLVIQTRGKKRRLAEATAGGEKLGPDGVVRPECVLQASPRKKRTRVVFTEPGGARPNANKSGGLGSGVGLEGEGKERSSVEESGLAGTGKVKQESDASEVAGEWRHNGSGERSEKRRPVAWLVPFKRRSEERTRALCTDSPPPASEPYTAGTPDASQGIPPDIPPPAADVRPLCDGATPPVSWPATPEKVRPSRPQMSPLPPAAGAAARSVRGLERVRDGDPGERTRGTATPETTAESPCKCSTCCCGEAGTVFVTLLVPCRTAMSGRFPLNGTYFQTNELFADHATSQRPLAAPAADFAGLPRCTVLFGTGATNMFKAASLEAVREVFQHGYICVRGFDVERRTPKPLSTRLHAGTSVKKK